MAVDLSKLIGREVQVVSQGRKVTGMFLTNGKPDDIVVPKDSYRVEDVTPKLPKE